MGLLVERVDVWAASIEDKPGSLAGKLAILARGGADLDFVIARRAPDKPGTGVLFVTPLTGDAQMAAAAEAGFAVTESLNSVRVEGENRPGIGAVLTQKIADAGINLRGLSAAVIGTRFISYLALDTEEDATKAMEILQASA
jgi:hypothetical protein